MSIAPRTGHQQARLCLQVHASLIVVLTRGGSTARLVAKYRPSIPVLTVAVPVLTTDSLTWTCSGEAPARQCLVTRGLLPLLAEGSARATDTDTTDEILQVGPGMHSVLLTCEGGCVVVWGPLLFVSLARQGVCMSGCVVASIAQGKLGCLRSSCCCRYHATLCPTGVSLCGRQALVCA